MEDREIIALFEARSEQAIEELGKKHGRYVSQVALNILHDAWYAEEAVNDTYLAAWNTIPPTRPENLFAYLAALCRNAALDVIKKNTAQKRSVQLVELTSEMNECIPDQSAISDERSDELAEYINGYLSTLPREKRLVFVGRYWYNESISDISRKTGFSQSKVKTMLHRMREDLREYIDRKDGSL